MLKSQKEREMSAALLGAAAELRNRSVGLGEALKTKERDALMTRELTNQIEGHLRPAVQDCESGRLSTEQALQALLKSSQAALAYARSLGESAALDARHVKGYVEGINAAAEFVNGMGSNLLREAERIETLAATDVDLDQKRQVGDRPESLRVKRKVAALRKESNDDDTVNLESE